MTALRIEIGTTDDDERGFIGDLVFSGWFEREDGNRLYLHSIIFRHKDEGTTQVLIGGWLDSGYDMRGVMPRSIMQHSLQKSGFVRSPGYLLDQFEDRVEMWYRPVSTEVSVLLPVKSAVAGSS